MKIDFWGQVGEHLQLMTPPAVATSVLEAVRNPECTFDTIAGHVSSDPALCGKLLRTVNSAVYGFPNPVGSIREAVRLLGLRGVRALVMAYTFASLKESVPAEGSTKEFLRRSVIGAVAARGLAARVDPASTEDVLVAGLLRDLGVMVFHQLYPEEYRELLEGLPPDNDLAMCDAEEATFGADHACVAAYILTSWGLPEEVTLPVEHHHRPKQLAVESPGLGKRASMVNFADLVARMHHSKASLPMIRSVLDKAKAEWGMNLKEFTEFLASLDEAIHEYAAYLDVDLSLAPFPVPTLDRLTKNDPVLPPLTVDEALPSTDPAGQLTSVIRVVPAESFRENEADTGQFIPSLADDPSCVNPMVHLQDELPEELAGHERYQIQEMLGRGGMGRVYKAIHRVMNRAVALKVIHPSLTADRDIVERFRREVWAAAQLSHPYIVTAYDAEQAGRSHFLVMEYVEGQSLDRFVENHGPPKVTFACRLIRQAASGLQHAHEIGMIHRDIKPQNLMVTPNRDVKILDFGLAVLADAHSDGEGAGRRITMANVIMGTPDYISPEQAAGTTEIDIRADLYSLGCTFFFLLTGREPFPVPSCLNKLRHHCEVDPPDVRDLRQDVPEGVAEIVRKLMAKKPAERFQTPAELVAALTQFASITDPRSPFTPRPASPTMKATEPDVSNESTTTAVISSALTQTAGRKRDRWWFVIAVSICVATAILGTLIRL